ncbi:MAG: hypothetical protein NWE84_04740 [Candidatus Bathyarchaeota archaeon]|nr:hypothetical protein [Candidatus Bathyarchaeota archaeon]
MSKLKGMTTITSDSYTLGEADGTHADVNTRNMKRLHVETIGKERGYSTAWFQETPSCTLNGFFTLKRR